MKRFSKPLLLLMCVAALGLLSLLFVSRQGQQRNQLLFQAASHGITTQVQNLLEQGADPNSFGDGELAPLHAAAFEGYDPTVRMLLDYGANANLPSKQWGETPLLAAVARGRVSTIKILLSNGADPNGKNKLGSTPLRKALIIEKLPSQRRNPEPKYHETELVLRQAGARP